MLTPWFSKAITVLCLVMKYPVSDGPPRELAMLKGHILGSLVLPGMDQEEAEILLGKDYIALWWKYDFHLATDDGFRAKSIRIHRYDSLGVAVIYQNGKVEEIRFKPHFNWSGLAAWDKWCWVDCAHVETENESSNK
jgi:hypothetical protein